MGTENDEAESASSYDPALDIVHEDFGWLEGDKIQVTVQSYDDGPLKLTLTRAGRKGKRRAAKRLTMAEATSLALVLGAHIDKLAALADAEDAK